jgi:cell division control protein 7
LKFGKKITRVPAVKLSRLKAFFFYYRSSKWAPRAGTSGFRAPEVLLRYTNQTTAVDVWSAGIILLCLLSGRYPFFKATDDNMAIMQLISVYGTEAVRKISNKYGEALLCDVEKDAVDLKFLCQSLHSTTTTLNQQVYPESVYNLLKNLLELDFEKRFSAEQALNHDFFKNEY